MGSCITLTHPIILWGIASLGAVFVAFINSCTCNAPNTNNGIVANGEGHFVDNLGDTSVVENGLSNADDQAADRDDSIIQCQVSNDDA